MAAARARPRLCFVTAVPLTLRAFFPSHIRRLAPHYDITLVSSGSADDVRELMVPNVTFQPVAIERQIAPAADLASLARLLALFRRERFDSVHSVTPKAGLLAMVAAKLAGVPHRIHTFTGQVWATRRGAGRELLRRADQVLAVCATRLLADSAAQRDFLIANGVSGARSTDVLGSGSVAGVDLSRFKPAPAIRAEIRRQLGVPDDAVAFIFVGRLTREKGVGELCEAFAIAAAADARMHLVVVGPDEGEMRDRISALGAQLAGRVHYCAYVERPEDYLAAADVLVLPSHREGFSVAVIEAAAAGVPAVASRIYGVTDFIEDGVTGLLHPVGDVGAIASAMTVMAQDEARRARLATAARVRAVESFSSDRVSEELALFYRELFEHQR